MVLGKGQRHKNRTKKKKKKKQNKTKKPRADCKLAQKKYNKNLYDA